MAAPHTILLSGAVRRETACRIVNAAPAMSRVEVHPPTRTLPQNSKLHAAITDVSLQVEWPIGSGTKRNPEAWKDIFTAALRSANHGLDVVPGLNGGFVLLGMHTSKMTVAEVSDLIELVHAFGAEHGVTFNDTTPSTSSPGGAVKRLAGEVVA